MIAVQDKRSCRLTASVFNRRSTRQRYAAAAKRRNVQSVYREVVMSIQLFDDLLSVCTVNVAVLFNRQINRVFPVEGKGIVNRPKCMICAICRAVFLCHVCKQFLCLLYRFLDHMPSLCQRFIVHTRNTGSGQDVMELVQQKKLGQRCNRFPADRFARLQCRKDGHIFQISKGNLRFPVISLDLVLIGQRAAVQLEIQLPCINGRTEALFFQLLHEITDTDMLRSGQPLYIL